MSMRTLIHTRALLLLYSKELWPVMDKWIKYRKGHANIAYIPDVIIASILRLIGEFLSD